jgi:hypothetical protein
MRLRGYVISTRFDGHEDARIGALRAHAGHFWTAAVVPSLFVCHDLLIDLISGCATKVQTLQCCRPWTLR